jgi:hypothetical protein
MAQHSEHLPECCAALNNGAMGAAGVGGQVQNVEDFFLVPLGSGRFSDMHRTAVTAVQRGGGALLVFWILAFSLWRRLPSSTTANATKGQSLRFSLLRPRAANAGQSSCGKSKWLPRFSSVVCLTTLPVRTPSTRQYV